MDIRLIIDGKATLEDLVELYEKNGVSFVIEGGHVTEVIF